MVLPDLSRQQTILLDQFAEFVWGETIGRIIAAKNNGPTLAHSLFAAV